MHFGVRMSATAILVIVVTTLAIQLPDQPAEARSGRDAGSEYASRNLTPQHSALRDMEGVYSLKSRLWLSPNDDPIVTHLAAKRSISLNGYVLDLTVNGRSESAYEFEGRGFTGFDTSTSQHWYVWMDTTSTGIATLHGTLSEDGSGTLYGSVTGRRPGISTPLRIEVRRDGSSEIHDYFSPGDDGKEWQWLELTYQKK